MSAGPTHNAALSDLNRATPTLMALGLGIYAYTTLGLAIDRSGLFEDWLGATIFVSALIVGWLPTIFVHELGHAIAAQASGWRVWMFSVGPFVFRLYPHFKLEFGSPLAIDAGGFVLPAPKTEAANTKARGICVTAAGPFVSVAAALASYLCALPFIDGGGADLVLAGTLVAFSASSWGSAALTLWPFSTDGIPNDARKIWYSLQSSYLPSPRQYAAALTHHGFAREDFDPWIRDIAVAAHFKEVTLAERFLSAIESSDFANAREMLGDEPDPTLDLMRAYLDANVDGDTAAAEAKLMRTIVLQWEIGDHLRDLTLASLMAAAGEFENSHARLDMLQQALPYSPSRHSAWRVLVARAREKLPPRRGPWERAPLAPSAQGEA